MAALLALLLATPLTLRFEDADVREVLYEIVAQTRVAVHLDDEFRGKKISLDVEEWQLVEVIEAIATRVGGKVLRESAGAYRILPEWKHMLRKRLNETKVALRLDDATPLRSVIQTFRELTGVPVVLDPGRVAWPDLELRAEDIAGARLLDLALAPHELTWELRYGVVFVSTRARLAELPARLDLQLPDLLVRLDLDEVPLENAAKVVGPMAGVEIEGEIPPDATVTLDVASIAARHAIELLLVPHGLDAEMKDGKLAVRKRVASTPYPNGFPELKKEAEALDRARKLTSKEELAKVAEEAIERLDLAFNETYGRDEGVWHLLYLAEWTALCGLRIDPDLIPVARDYLTTVEEQLGGLETDDPDARRILAAARATRRRLETASK